VAAGDHDAAADLLARAAAALREASPALAAEALAARSAVLRSGGRPEDAAAAGAGSRALRVTPPPAAAPPPATDPDAPPPAVDEAMLAAAMADLDALVGLAPVKEEIRRLVAYSRVQRRRAEAGRKVPALAHHLLFLGPPGTGKTTVARLLGRLYRAVGVLRSGHLVETDRSGLVAGFVGQTAPKVNEACDRALDGVLFIDEAYALVRPGAQSDFGEEALAALLKRMEDDRMRLLVVLAGYEGPMREMLDANPGLASRIPNHVEFHSYTADELAEILRRMARADDYRLDAEADSALREIAGALAAHAAEPDFGNARTMRNLYEEALMRHAERVADDPAADLNALVAADLRDAAEALPE
jgi:SpoVK/Ycf46/Vps4 family AAA+-type ATPase